MPIAREPMRLVICLFLFSFFACDYRVQVGSPDASTPASDASTPDASTPEPILDGGLLPVQMDCEPQLVDEGRDGCPSNALCVVRANVEYCVPMRPCSPALTCSINPAGAVCNDGWIPGKDKVCIETACRSELDCPSNWLCFRRGAEVLGQCSSRGFGSPCARNDQCVSNSCSLIAFGLGWCD